MATTELREVIDVGSLKIGVKHGGLGLDYLCTGRVLRVLASADFPFAFSLAVHSAVDGSISEYGSPSQLDRYIRRIQTGELILSVGITEPSAGTDAAAMQTRATRIQGGWRINGSKAWITNAASADPFLLYAQTDVDGAPAGIAAFFGRERVSRSLDHRRL